MNKSQPWRRLTAMTIAMFFSLFLFSACSIYPKPPWLTEKRALVELRVNKETGQTQQKTLYELSEDSLVYYDIELVGIYSVSDKACGFQILEYAHRRDLSSKDFIYIRDAVATPRIIGRVNSLPFNKALDSGEITYFDLDEFKLWIFNQTAETLTPYTLNNQLVPEESKSLNGITGEAGRDIKALVRLSDGWLVLAADTLLGMVFADLDNNFTMRRAFFAAAWPSIYERTDIAAVRYSDEAILAIQAPSSFNISAVYADPSMTKVERIDLELNEFDYDTRPYIFGSDQNDILFIGETRAATLKYENNAFSVPTQRALLGFDLASMRLDAGQNGAVISSGPKIRPTGSRGLSVYATIYKEGASPTIETAPKVPEGWCGERSAAISKACQETETEYVFLLELYQYVEEGPWFF